MAAAAGDMRERVQRFGVPRQRAIVLRRVAEYSTVSARAGSTLSSMPCVPNADH